MQMWEWELWVNGFSSISSTNWILNQESMPAVKIHSGFINLFSLFIFWLVKAQTLHFPQMSPRKYVKWKREREREWMNKSDGWRSLVGYSPWGRKESNTTEWLHFHFHACVHTTGYYTVVELIKVFWNQRNLGSNHGSICLLCICCVYEPLL